jgi:hypothetical protein
MTGTAQIDVQATDKDGATLGSPFVIDVNVTTPPPVAGSVTITNTGNNTLVANATITDSNGDTTFPNTTYQWYVNGTAINDTTSPSAATSTLNLAQLTVNPGDQFTVAVTPKDGSVAGATVTSKPITVGTATASVTNLSIAPDSTTNATTLTVTPTNADSAGDPVTDTYQWYQNGKAINDTSAPSAETATLELSQVTANANDTFTVQVTPSDANGPGAPVDSNAVTLSTVTNFTGGQAIATPSAIITALTVSPDSATNATTLTATPTAVTQASPTSVTYAYQWFQNGTAINDTTAPSADTATLQLSQLGAVNLGDKFTVEVTPTDSNGTGNAVTSSPLTVTGDTPYTISGTAGIASPTAIITGVKIGPTGTANTTSLTATPTSTESTGVTYTYQWFQNGTLITATTANGAGTATLNLSALTVNSGDQFTVQVTPSDTNGAGATVTSAPATITSLTTVSGGSGIASTGTAVGASKVTSLSISADSPSAATVLTAKAAGDNDGTGAVTYSYQWTLSGSDISGGSEVVGSSSTLTLTGLTNSSGGQIATTDTLTVKATPSDGGAAYTANVPLTITAGSSTNTYALKVPTVTTPKVGVSSSTPNLLTVTPTGTDPVGNTEGYTYQWLQNGTAIPGATSSTLSLTAPGLTVNTNDAFSVEVTPTDTASTSGQSTIIIGTQATSSNDVFVASTNPLSTVPVSER